MKSTKISDQRKLYAERRAWQDTIINGEIELAFEEGAKWAMSQFHHQGTDGCKTCMDGRINFYVKQVSCIMCDPESY
jgi:hypothetical protein